MQGVHVWTTWSALGSRRCPQTPSQVTSVYSHKHVCPFMWICNASRETLSQEDNDEGKSLLLHLNLMRLSGMTFRDGFHPGLEGLGICFEGEQHGCVWEVLCNTLISEADEQSMRRLVVIAGAGLFFLKRLRPTCSSCFTGGALGNH